MAQTATIELEYLMTVQGALEAPQTIDAGYGIVGVTGGWADGPKIKAKVVGPGGDWFQVLPSGVAKLDVRLTLMTDDEQLIFVSYNGVVDREVRGTPDAPHITIAPTFRTSSQKYAWLNHLQAVGKMVQRSTDRETGSSGTISLLFDSLGISFGCPLLAHLGCQATSVFEGKRTSIDAVDL